jgi:CO/xanthine dehydrogenase FAD-binding subunit
MKPPSFDYVLAETVKDALSALANLGPDAKIIAGGQSLVPMLNFRLLRPTTLVDINRIAGLSFIADEAQSIRIGALTRHHRLETSPVIATHLPVIAEAMRHVAHLAIRNRGTIGGSLSHADPAAELPMMAVLLDAKLTIAAAAGKRIVPAREFFVDALTTDLRDGELLTEIEIPRLAPQSGWGFEEVSRRGGDFALAAAAAILTLHGGTIAEARIAVMGVGKTPLRMSVAEAMLAGQKVSPDLLEQAAEAVRAAVEPETDLHASADYRRHLIGVLTQRTLADAWRRAGGASPGIAP